jgi:HlyD family secretion protein
MDIGRLQRGLPARITLDPYPGVVWHGTVSRVAQFVNDVQQQNRTLEIEVALAREAGLPVPKPGASADVEIIIRSRADALRVPTAALLEGHRVLVAERGHAVSREVTTGLRNWDWTEVRGGLKEGESVITTLDRQGLKAGAAIRAKERPGASGAPETARRP